MVLLLVFTTLISKGQLTPVFDNFNDGNINTGPSWSGNTGNYSVSTTSPLEGTHHLTNGSTGTVSTIYTQYGNATNLGAANYSFSMLYRDNGTLDPSTVGAWENFTNTSYNHWRFYLAANSTNPNTATGVCLAHSGNAIKLLVRTGSGNGWEAISYPISRNTTYSIKVVAKPNGNWELFVDAGTAEATTSRGSQWPNLFKSGSQDLYMIFQQNATTGNSGRFQWDVAGIFSKSLTITQLTNGVHTGDLEQGMTNKALLGFAATSAGSVTLESVTINNTGNSNGTGVYPTVKLYSSIDDNYTTAGDNTEITGLSVARNGSRFIISNINHTLNSETRNYFFVVDVSSTGTLPSSVQMSMACNSCGGPNTNVITTNGERVLDFNFSGSTYNFLRVCTWWHTADNPTQLWKDDWQTSNAWLNYGGPPTANDVVAFSRGGNVTPLNIPSQSIKRVVISNNTTVNITTASLANGSMTLTVAGGSGLDFEIEAGSVLNIIGTGNTIALSLASNTTANIAGTLNVSGAAHSLTAATTGSVTFSNGGVFVGGAGLTGNVFGNTTTGSVVFQQGSTLEDQAGRDYFSASNVIILQPGSLYRHNTSITPSLNNKTFGNIELSSGATLAIGANTYNIAGDITGAGTLTASGGIINIQGNLVTTGTFTQGIGSQVNFTGSASQLVRGGTYRTISFTGGNKTATGNIQATSFTLDNGCKLNMDVYNLTGSLSTINNSGTIITSSIATASIAANKTWGGTIELALTAGGQSVAAGTYKNLKLRNSAGTVTVRGAININDSLITTAGGIMNFGTQVLGGSLNAIINDGEIRTSNISATPLPPGKTWGGTIRYNVTTGNQTIVNGTYNNLYLNNTSDTNKVNGNITVDGTLTTRPGGFLNMNAFALSGAITTITNSGTILTANTTGTPVPAGRTWGGRIVFNGTDPQYIVEGTFTNLELSNSAGASLNANVTVNAALALTNGKLGLGSNTLTLNGTAVSMSAANSLTGSSNATLNVGGSSVLGTLYFNQSLPGTTNVINNFIINRTNLGGNLTLGNMLKLTGTLTPTAGTLHTGGFLTLASSASGTGKILQINPANFALNGHIKAERYFTAKTSRRWLFVSSPVADITFRDGWQDDIFITGIGTGGTVCGTGGTEYNSNGFDASVANAPTVYTYDQTLPARWESIPNTTSTNVSKGVGYRVLIRGSRNEANACTNQILTQAPTAPVETVIAATGMLTTGNVPVAVSAKTTGTFGYTLLGNPYPSEINFSAFYSANSGVISNKYWTYDPGSESTNYLVYNNGIVAGNAPSGTITDMNGHIIAAGQAFFVESVNGGTATFTEWHKSGATQIGAFRTNAINRLIRTTFKNADGSFIDNMVLRFSDDPSVTVAENPFWDAVTMNSGNFIAAIKDARSFAIQTRPLDFFNDTVWVRVVSSEPGDYKLSFTQFNNFTEAAQIILLDLYNGTQHDVRASPEYAFTITAAAATQGGRFKLVFRSLNSVMPVTFTGISAALKGTVAELNWKLAFEQHVLHYEIERSKNGRSFENIGTVVSRGNSNVPVIYLHNDNDPLDGTSYYRVKAIDQNGTVSYSPVVTLSQKITGKLLVYPNPVTTKLHLQLPASGSVYRITIRNAHGLVIKTFEQGGGSVKMTDLKHLATGIYFIQAANNSNQLYSGTFIRQ